MIKMRQRLPIVKHGRWRPESMFQAIENFQKNILSERKAGDNIE